MNQTTQQTLARWRAAGMSEATIASMQTDLEKNPTLDNAIATDLLSRGEFNLSKHENDASEQLVVDMEELATLRELKPRLADNPEQLKLATDAIVEIEKRILAHPDMNEIPMDQRNALIASIDLLSAKEARVKLDSIKTAPKKTEVVVPPPNTKVEDKDAMDNKLLKETATATFFGTTAIQDQKQTAIYEAETVLRRRLTAQEHAEFTEKATKDFANGGTSILKTANEFFKLDEVRATTAKAASDAAIEAARLAGYNEAVTRNALTPNYRADEGASNSPLISSIQERNKTVEKNDKGEPEVYKQHSRREGIGAGDAATARIARVITKQNQGAGSQTGA